QQVNYDTYRSCADTSPARRYRFHARRQFGFELTQFQPAWVIAHPSGRTTVRTHREEEAGPHAGSREPLQEISVREGYRDHSIGLSLTSGQLRQSRPDQDHVRRERDRTALL